MTNILRLARTDEPGHYLLVHITQNASHSDHHIDLKLVGTEHEHLYHYHLTTSTVPSLQQQSKSQSSPTSDDLASVIKHALLHQSPTPLPSILENIETVATIKSSTLTITIRTSHSGITHPLLRIPLAQDDEREEVSPFDWVDVAVAASDTLRDELLTLRVDLESQKEVVKGLEERMDELVRVKRENEREMVEKFVGLLNAKKGKVRELLRLVEGKPTRVHASDGKGGKRKIGEVEEAEEMDVDGQDVEGDDPEEVQQAETPPRTDDEETEDEEDLDAQVNLSSDKGKEKSVETAQPARDNDAEMILDEPPSRKESASISTKPPTTRAAAAAATQNDDDDTETEDEDDLDAPTRKTNTRRR